jgi:hypothetical protein
MPREESTAKSRYVDVDSFVATDGRLAMRAVPANPPMGGSPTHPRRKLIVGERPMALYK